MNAAPTRAPVGRIGVYALPALFLALVTTPLTTFVPSLYAQHRGLPFAMVGAMLFASRFTDVLTDPLIGWLSDRTRTRIGRRKPWILAGLPLVILSCWMTFNPPAHVGPLHLLVWISLLYIGLTLIDIPYQAWGAELSTDYATRSRIQGLKQGFAQVSSMLALAIAGLLPLLGQTGTPRVMFWLAMAACLSVPLGFAVPLVVLKEPPPEDLRREPLRWREGLAAVSRNRPFLKLLAAATLFVAGASITAALHLFVIEHVFKAPKLFPITILGEALASLVAIPLWVKLSDRVGKHRAAALAAAWSILWSLPFPLMGPSQLHLFLGMVVIRGLGSGGLVVLLLSMLADVVDVDTASSGRQRTGVYFALLLMAQKLAVALGVLAGTAIPARFGFEPSHANTPGALFSLAVVYAWVPDVIKLGAVPLLWAYPLTAALQKRVRGEIEASRTTSATNVPEVRT